MDDTQKWTTQKEEHPLGSLVQGKVLKLAPFGVFLALDGVDFPAVLLVTHFEDNGRGRELDEYPRVGEVVSAVIVGFVDDNRQVRVSTRISDMERSI